MAGSLRLTVEQLVALVRRNKKATGNAPAARKPQQARTTRVLASATYKTHVYGQEPQKRLAVPFRKPPGRSEAEEQLAYQIRAAKLPVPVRQWRFAPPRRFTADFGWPHGCPDPAMPFWAVAVEIEGGVFMRGKSSHSSGTGILRDMEKGNEYALRGIRCLRVTPEQVKSGQALALIERLLKNSG